MKCIINKKVLSAERTTKTVGHLEKPTKLKDKELRAVAGGKSKGGKTINSPKCFIVLTSNGCQPNPA